MQFPKCLLIQCLTCIAYASLFCFPFDLQETWTRYAFVSGTTISNKLSWKSRSNHFELFAAASPCAFVFVSCFCIPGERQVERHRWKLFEKVTGRIRGRRNYGCLATWPQHWASIRGWWQWGSQFLFLVNLLLSCVSAVMFSGFLISPKPQQAALSNSTFKWALRTGDFLWAGVLFLECPGELQWHQIFISGISIQQCRNLTTTCSTCCNFENMLLICITSASKELEKSRFVKRVWRIVYRREVKEAWNNIFWMLHCHPPHLQTNCYLTFARCDIFQGDVATLLAWNLRCLEFIV